MDQERGMRYFPIGLFASVMGFAGVTIAISQAEQLFDLGPVLSNVLLTWTVLLFLFLLSIFIYRLIRYPKDVQADFNHPVKMNFFGAISISLLLLARAFLPINNELSFVLWIIGAILQITLTLLIISKLIWKHTFKIEQFNPIWFIPIVGNIVVPLAGSVHVSLELNSFFFGIGILFSIIYLALFFYRAVFYPGLPPMLLPSYFILMAPPAVGFTSYLSLTAEADLFAMLLFGIAFFIGLLLLFQMKRFLTIPFFITWWALLFPSAAMTIATIQMYVISDNSIFQILFVLQIIGLIVLTIYLLVQTIKLAVQKKLCVKE